MQGTFFQKMSFNMDGVISCRMFCLVRPKSEYKKWWWMEFQVSSHLFISDLMNIILKKKKILLFQDTLYKLISLKSKQKYTSWVIFNNEKRKIYSLLIFQEQAQHQSFNFCCYDNLGLLLLDRPLHLHNGGSASVPEMVECISKVEQCGRCPCSTNPQPSYPLR